MPLNSFQAVFDINKKHVCCVSEVFDSHCFTNVELVPKAGSLCIVMFCVGAVSGSGCYPSGVLRED